MACLEEASIPDNIALLPLPPKSPELNPVENIWQFMRDNWLSNRVFKSYDDILDHCCHRHAVENHVHRHQRLGLPVMIIKTWYYPLATKWKSDCALGLRTAASGSKTPKR
jgi:hypothetical protein